MDVKWHLNYVPRMNTESGSSEKGAPNALDEWLLGDIGVQCELLRAVVWKSRSQILWEPLEGCYRG